MIDVVSRLSISAIMIAAAALLTAECSPASAPFAAGSRPRSEVRPAAIAGTASLITLPDQSPVP